MPGSQSELCKSRRDGWEFFVLNGGMFGALSTVPPGLICFALQPGIEMPGYVQMSLTGRTHQRFDHEIEFRALHICKAGDIFG